MPSYTARELERESGFDRRTIAYYVQEGLLPKVGRRGPRTRYPQLFLDRLLFIRRVREAEEEGTVPSLSLSDLREVFERIAPVVVARVADGRIAVTPELVSSPTTAFRLPEMEATGEPVASLRRPEPRSFGTARERRDRVASRLQRTAGPAMDSPRARMAAPPVDSDEASVPASPMPRSSRLLREGPGYGSHHLGSLLAALENIGRHRRGSSPGPVETWSRIRISSNIEFSVRGVTEEDRSLIDSVRSVMRELIQSACLARELEPESGEGHQE